MQLGQIMDKILKRPETQLPLLKSWEQKRGSGTKAGYSTCHLHSTPTRGGQTTQATPLARPIDTPLPSPHKRNQLSPAQGASKESLTCSHSPCCSRGPSKAWISFLASDQFLFSSVAQSCSTLCNPTDCSTPGFPIHHQLLELAQTHVSEAIQPSHPLSSPSPAFNLSQHQGLFQ